jgi:alkylation response protein AidB-like acyl-CoA dehydrogenase
MSQAESTVVLLEKARTGDREALESLLARYIPPLRRWAAGRLPTHLRGPLDTHDVVQDAVLQTLGHIERFEQRHDGALRAYLRQAVMNRIRDELRRAAVRPAGSAIGTVALLEPGRRAAWSEPSTTARVDGGGWVLDGAKVHVPDAVAASILLVSACDHDGALGVFAARPGDAGVTVEATPTIDGSRKEATITLAGASARRIGADARDALASTVDRLGIAAVVDGVGTAARALELTVEYATQRRQFDVPIGSFQAVQHLCADMLRSVELARAAGYYACWAADDAPASERHRATTLALAFATDDLYGVGASAVQVHGGIGFTWEHDIHLFYKRLLTLQQAGGGSVDQLEELARIVID